MNTTESSRASSSDTRYAVQMPLDEPISSMDNAVEQLQKVPHRELRRARRHHQRALKALGAGCYEELSDPTRDQLIARLRADLDALNQALTSHSSSPQWPPSRESSASRPQQTTAATAPAGDGTPSTADERSRWFPSFW